MSLPNSGKNYLLYAKFLICLLGYFFAFSKTYFSSECISGEKYVFVFVIFAFSMQNKNLAYNPLQVKKPIIFSNVSSEGGMTLVRLRLTSESSGCLCKGQYQHKRSSKDIKVGLFINMVAGRSIRQAILIEKILMLLLLR